MASRKLVSICKRRKLDRTSLQGDGFAAVSESIISVPATSISKDGKQTQGETTLKHSTRRSIKSLSQSGTGEAYASASELRRVREAPSGAVLATPACPAEPAEGGSSGVVRTIDGLVTGCLVKRYKRFLADVQIDDADPDSEHTVVHCPNTGPMTGLLDLPMANVWLSTSANAKRKYAHTLEAIQPEPHGTWVGVHSASANGIVREMLQQGLLADLLPYVSVRQEVKYGEGGKSRVDFVLETKGGGDMYVEVKSVTLAETLEAPGVTGSKDSCAEEPARIGLFPDTVSDRAQRHVRDLMGIVAKGGQAAMVFVIQRADCACFGPCHAKDPTYGRLVIEAAAMGVRVIALRCGLEGDVPNGRGIVRYLGPAQVLLEYKSVIQC